MFNIGGGEFVVIALIALIVLGPQRLPEAARQVGKAMGDLRRISSGFQNELKSATADVAEQRAQLAAPRPAMSSGAARSSTPRRPPRPPPAARPAPAKAPLEGRSAAKKAAATQKAARPRTKGS